MPCFNLRHITLREDVRLGDSVEEHYERNRKEERYRDTIDEVEDSTRHTANLA